MSEKPKTRGVFAIITAAEQKSILISLRADGKGWNLPGGGTDGQDDVDALMREVLEETGVEVDVIERLGPPHDFEGPKSFDTAVAYVCIPSGGELVATSEAQMHLYVTKEELKAGVARRLAKDCHGLAEQFEGERDIPLKLVGPEGRLGRTGRMVFDGLSILEEPERGPNGVPEPTEGIFASDDNLYLIEEADGERRKWRRLDPHTPSGYMEPAAAPAS